MSNVIKFPLGIKEQERVSFKEDPVHTKSIDNSHTIIHFAVDLLREEGYDIQNEQFTKDMGLIANFLYATMVRAKGREHVLSEVMDDLRRELDLLRQITDDLT